MNDDKAANEAQKKLFFALVDDLAQDAEVAKERAKKVYNLEHFNDITSEQISTLIDKMQGKVAFKEIEKEFPETKEIMANGNYPYKFKICVTGEYFPQIAKIFHEISEGTSGILGQDITVSPQIPITTITITTGKELAPDQIKALAEMIQVDFRERLKSTAIEVVIEK